ncbi:MAG: universal stress protein [Bacteroidales bacterium]
MVKAGKRSGKGTRVILVLTDFSTIAENAVVHGLELAQRLQYKVCLLHVTRGESVLEKVEKNMMDCIARCEQKFAVKIDALIRDGNLFKVVNKVVSVIKPVVMVMGTHGKQGLQHLFGSHALKLVLDSPCPVMVVQDEFPGTGYNHIVIPVNIDADPENLAKWSMAIGTLFHSAVTLFLSKEESEERSRQLRNITSLITGVLAEQHIPFTITAAESVADFPGQVIAWSEKNHSSLLMTMAMPTAGGTGHSFSDWNERLMFNSGRMPVLFIDRAEP